MPQVGTPGSITQVDTFAIPEAQDPASATGFGDLSVHEVAIDPTPGKKLAYVSYYAGGFRILQYDNDGLTEVGAFIDQGGPLRRVAGADVLAALTTVVIGPDWLVKRASLGPPC